MVVYSLFGISRWIGLGKYIEKMRMGINTFGADIVVSRRCCRVRTPALWIGFRRDRTGGGEKVVVKYLK